MYLRRNLNTTALAQMARVTTVNGAPQWTGSILFITILCAGFFLFTTGLRRNHLLHARFRCKEMSTLHHSTLCQTISKAQIESFVLPSTYVFDEINKTWMLGVANSICKSDCSFARRHFTRLKHKVLLVVDFQISSEEDKEDVIYIYLWGRMSQNKTQTWRQRIMQVQCKQESEQVDIRYESSFTRAEVIEKLTVTEATTQDDRSGWLCLVHIVIWLYLLYRHKT